MYEENRQEKEAEISMHGIPFDLLFFLENRACCVIIKAGVHMVAIWPLHIEAP